MNSHLFGQPRHNRFFTLIELLVVMAILAILVSMINPALTSVLKFSRQNVCTNQLGKIGIATAIYLDNNNDFFPVYKAEGDTWYNHLLAESLGGTPLAADMTKTQLSRTNLADSASASRLQADIWSCPSDTSLNNVPGYFGCSYNMLGWYTDVESYSSFIIKTGGIYNDPTDPATYRGRRLSEIQNNSMFLLEGTYWTSRRDFRGHGCSYLTYKNVLMGNQIPNGIISPEVMHAFGSINALFVDNHVQLLNYWEAVDPLLSKYWKIR